MRPPARSLRRQAALVIVAVVGWLAASDAARAQNDWQFPDPYFGAAVAGRRPVTTFDERRYRAEVTPPVRNQRPKATVEHRPRSRRRARVRHR